MLSVLAFALVSGAPGIALEPNDGACPSSDALTEQLAPLGIAVDGGAEYRLSLVARRGVIRLRLLDAAGRERAARELPMSSDCASLTAAISVAVSTWLMKLANDALLPPIAELPPGSVARPTEMAASVAAEVVLPVEPEARHRSGLVLDDPGMGWAFSMRGTYSAISVPESGAVAMLFLAAAVPITQGLTVEGTLPLALIEPDQRGLRSLTQIGNPLLAVKGAIELPSIAGRRLELALRGRWGIPVAPDGSVAVFNEVQASQLSLPAAFADTYAFMLERHDLGLGGSAALDLGWLRLGAQLYGDGFLPLPGAQSQQNFFALGWGGSISLWPFEDRVGLCAEARGASLWASGGGSRSGAFGYLGARLRFLDVFEPAVWVALPLVPAESTQLGLEMRVALE